MRFIYETGFDVKEGKTAELQRWLEANEEKLALESPQGCRYIGTYAAIYSSEKGVGDFRLLLELDNYAAQDSFAGAMKEGGAFARLFEEYTAFTDQRNGAATSQHLLRKVTDAAIWGE
jgi:hypothetical protein